MNALARLDHVIFAVPDIRVAHSRFLEGGFAEAWPIGPFWTGALTSGIAIGGFNLELVEPLDQPVTEGIAPTLVFEPSSLEAGKEAYRAAGIEYEILEKIEVDPDLLRARGFPAAMAAEPQLICSNLIHDDRDDLPFNFFLCDYAPFLKEWLSPKHPRFSADRRVERITYGTPDPDTAAQLLSSFGYDGDVEIEFEPSSVRGVRGIYGAEWSLFLGGNRS